MNTLRRLFLLAIFMLLGTHAMVARAHPIVALSEQFNNVNTLTGWTFYNASSPPGLDWFQGNAGVFPAHQGTPDAYVAANFMSAQNGNGTIDNWLITPQLVLGGATNLSFFARAAHGPGSADRLEVRFGSDGDFSTLLATLGGSVPIADSWQQFCASFHYFGTGQFALRYLGDAAMANFIGLDTLLVTTVPEPSAWLLAVAGMLAMVVLHRQRQF